MNEIYHFGTKRHSGRYPWGSGQRPYQGEVLKKGSSLSRLTLSENENVKNVRKYVSIGDHPEEFWLNLMSDGYAKMGYEYLYSNRYEAVKDLKVASTKAQQEIYDQWFQRNRTALVINLPIVIDDWAKSTGGRKTGDLQRDFFRQLGINNPVSRSYLDYLKTEGFDAIEDVYGRESGGDKSLIILDPDKTLKLKEQEKIKIR